MTIEDLLELARQTMEYSATASPRPWTPSREPRPASNRYFDRHTTDGSTPIESRGTQFALGVAVGVTSDPVDADAIAFWRNNADTLARAVQVLANALRDIERSPEWDVVQQADRALHLLESIK